MGPGAPSALVPEAARAGFGAALTTGQDITLNDVAQTLDARIARAGALAVKHSEAREILRFYANLARYQKSLLSDRPSPGPSDLRSSGPSGPGFREALDLDAALGAIPGLLEWLVSHAPARLAEAADTLRQGEQAEWRKAIEDHVTVGGGSEGDQEPSAVAFVAAAMVQPIAERQAQAREPEPGKSERPTLVKAPAGPLCPICDSPPVVGVLRPEGHGARRSLICSLCLSEHDYMRVVCPGCGERRFEALPIFTADQFDYVRIEACDSCRTYLKTIDLTKDGHAIPVVDDIASVSLDVWARDRGYVRLRRNLLGL
jgi:FdhE protein